MRVPFKLLLLLVVVNIVYADTNKCEKENEIWSDITPDYSQSCSILPNQIGQAGCVCEKGFVRNSAGECEHRVTACGQCPDPNEVFTPKGKAIEPECDPLQELLILQQTDQAAFKAMLMKMTSRGSQDEEYYDYDDSKRKKRSVDVSIDVQNSVQSTIQNIADFFEGSGDNGNSDQTSADDGSQYLLPCNLGNIDVPKTSDSDKTKAYIAIIRKYCYCKQGYARDVTGECVLYDQCPGNKKFQ